MKDITLYEFNALDEFDNGAALWEYGVYLTQRFDGEIGYSLYQLNNFYVEVLCNGGENKITKFTSFCNLTKLGPYIEKIDIEKLFID